MRSTIENWNGTDADLLVELNRKQHKVLTPNPDSKPGFFGFRGMAQVNTQLAVQFGYTLKSLADGMANAVDAEGNPDLQTRALSTTVLGFWHILYTDTQGLNFADETLRAQLTTLLQSAGWQQLFIDAVLAFGYTLQSDADRTLGRDATQADVDAVRAVIERETIQADWATLFASTIQPQLETGTLADIVAAIRAVADGMEG